jgi:RimK family alpha-L-glutamate ligase
MKKEILLTHNTNFRYWSYEVDKLKIAIEQAGYTCRPITSEDMYKDIPDEDLPYAILPLIGNSCSLPDIHLHCIRRLELRGVKVVNKIFDSRIADNKMLAHLELKYAGFPVLKTLDLDVDHVQNFPDVISNINNTIGFPCVIKPVNSHSAIGVHKVNDIEHLKEVMNLLTFFSLRTFDRANTVNLVVQEYLPTGNEVIRVNVLDNKCLGGLFKVNKTGWRTNSLIEGGERHPIELDKEITELSISVAQHFKLNYMSLDIFKTDKGYIVNELGSMPALRVFDEMNPNMNVSKMLVDFLLRL